MPDQNRQIILSLALAFTSMLSLLYAARCNAQASPHDKSQVQSSIKIITGKILSITNDEPISYATVTTRRGSINSMSNEKGEFILKLPANAGNDSLTISHVNFETSTIAQTGVTLEIKLQPKQHELQEVVIKVPDATALVKQAIARIPENYSTKPYLMHGFYRLTGTEEKRIVQMSEAAFQIYNADYARKNKQVKLLKARIDKDLTAFNGNDDFHFGTSPKGLLDIDIVSNANATDFITKNGLKQYQFTYKGTTKYQGADAHVIYFDQKDGVRESLHQGKVIIDAESLAFLQFTYRASPKGLKYFTLPGAPKLLLKLARLSIDMLQDSFQVTYQKSGDKYYLSHVQETTFWHITGGKEHFELDPLRMKYNYLVTEIDTSNVTPFATEDLMRPSRFMEMTVGKNVSDSLDPFWDKYNLILPEFNVDLAAMIIHQNNESLKLKDIIDKRLSKIKGNRSVRIDSILNHYYKLNRFNGVALVEYDGRVIYEKAFGAANKEKGIANDSITSFRIGSATKPFTSLLIMQLAEQHKLSLKDTVGKYITGYVHGTITIEQLLTHQSGIPNYTNNYEHLTMILAKKYNTNELITLFCSDSLEFHPGTAFRYSNSGFVVLAGIIETITGKSYAQVLHEKIFLPAEMANSFFVHPPDSATTNFRGQMAQGYVNEEAELSFPIENIIGAGGISSTARDLLLFNRSLSAGALLSPAGLEATFSPRVNWKEWNADYGYGWMLDRGEFKAAVKHPIQYHPGTEPGFYTMMIRQPDKKITIILLSNKGDFPRFDIADLILNELN